MKYLPGAGGPVKHVTLKDVIDADTKMCKKGLKAVSFNMDLGKRELKIIYKKEMKIVLEFDYTCVAYAFPGIGKDIGAVPVLKDLVAQGHKLILAPMRADGGKHGDILTQAVKWFEDNGIELWSVSKDKGQDHWTNTNKCFGNLYIDSAGIGCPLIYPEGNAKPYVDWVKVREILVEMNLLPSESDNLME